MRIAVVIFMLVSSLLALGVGDKIDKETQQKLNLQDEKIAVVAFFAAWCSSCKKELPHIEILSKEIDKDRYEIVGVGVDKNPKATEALVKKLGISFRTINDPDNEIIKEFNPVGIPSIYYVKDGVILRSMHGSINSVEQVIAKDLKELDTP